MRHYTLFFAALLLVSCLSTPAPAAAIPTNTPVWLPTEIPASGLVYLPLEPAGTPEANPSLIVELDILDAVTQQPVAANVYLVHATEYREPTPTELMLHNTERVEIKLPATPDSWFVIRAPGYAD